MGKYSDDIFDIIKLLITHSPGILLPLIGVLIILLLVIRYVFIGGYKNQDTILSRQAVNQHLRNISVNKTKDLENFLSKVREDITKGKTEVAIEKLVSQNYFTADATAFLQLLSNQLYKEKNNFNKGIGYNPEVSNRITNSTLEFIAASESELKRLQKNDEPDQEIGIAKIHEVPISQSPGAPIIKDWYRNAFHYQSAFIALILVAVVQSVALIYMYAKFQENPFRGQRKITSPY